MGKKPRSLNDVMRVALGGPEPVDESQSVTLRMSMFTPPAVPEPDIPPVQMQTDTGLPVGLVSYAQAAQIAGLTPQDIHNAVRSGTLNTPSAAEMKNVPNSLRKIGIVYRRELIKLASAGLP